MYIALHIRYLLQQQNEGNFKNLYSMSSQKLSYSFNHFPILAGPMINRTSPSYNKFN